ncbi:hypothetical protein GCM10017667_54590 [Streptomyces filamentosus]|uniref:Uncharacterized protein n=1 Tax=Streptomyces filamentosus TaxID=67294 RepID=A0A919ERP6_STRFL|nr:hypothetical protein GCM10017667_54590 [Streptomyces filamentosus]
MPHLCAAAEWAEDRRMADAAARRWQIEPDLGWDDHQRVAEEKPTSGAGPPTPRPSYARPLASSYAERYFHPLVPSRRRWLS